MEILISDLPTQHS